MLHTQSLIGSLNMRKGYAMYYHVEISQISRVNLQMGCRNEKVQDFLVQDVCGNFMEHRKKGEVAVSLYTVCYGRSLHCNHRDMLFVC